MDTRKLGCYWSINFPSTILLSRPCHILIQKRDRTLMLSQGFKNLLVSLGHMLTDSQKLCVADKIREFVTSVLDVKMNEWWAAIKVCPTLRLFSKCALSIFHGPQVESSFSFMKDLMSKKKVRMTMSTFSSMQTIKYYLMSKKAVSVRLFQRSSINHTPVDCAIAANIISATRCRKEERSSECTAGVISV